MKGIAAPPPTAHGHSNTPPPPPQSTTTAAARCTSAARVRGRQTVRWGLSASSGGAYVPRTPAGAWPQIVTEPSPPPYTAPFHRNWGPGAVPHRTTPGPPVQACPPPPPPRVRGHRQSPKWTDTAPTVALTRAGGWVGGGGI